MKHLFYVHSHITNLVAKQIVIEENLKVEDCLFLLARNYKSDFKNSLPLPYTHYPIDSFGIRVLFWENWKKLKALDIWIDEITNKAPYLFYTPQSGFNFFYLMVNQIKCQGYLYLEEGLCSYLSEDQLQSGKKEFWLRDRWYDLNFKNKVPSVKHFYNLEHPKYLGCYGLSENSFPSLSKKKILAFSASKDKEKSIYQHVVVLGQYVEYGEMTKKTLLEVIRYLLDWFIKKEIKSIHIKFHPAQQQQASILPLTELFKEYNSKLKIHLMEQQIVLEEIAINTDANFYIVSSSIGIYASIT